MEMKNVATLMAILVHYTVISIMILPYWKTSQNQLSDGVYRTLPAFEGIWWRCLTKRVGEFFCDTYAKPLFRLSRDIHALRTLMSLACIFSFFAVLLSFLSLECVTVLKDRTKGKVATTLVAAAFEVFGGLCCGVSVAWYAANVVAEFRSPFFQEGQLGFELGPCIYIGFVAMFFAFVSGILLTLVSCRERSRIRRSESDKTYKFPEYKPRSHSRRTYEKSEYI